MRVTVFVALFETQTEPYAPIATQGPPPVEMRATTCGAAAAGAASTAAARLSRAMRIGSSRKVVRVRSKVLRARTIVQRGRERFLQSLERELHLGHGPVHVPLDPPQR